MKDLTGELKNKKINNIKLLNYGFIKKDHSYIYKTKIYNNKFEAIINISKNQPTAALIDLENNEEYILVDIKGASGNFVNRIKEEYENIIKDIIDKCMEPDIFKSLQANEIIKYVKEKYNDELEYLWQKFPNNAIWRNKKNNKWYGVLLVVKENKLAIESDKLVEIIDLRFQKENIHKIIDNNRFYPGYHMNKNNWITIKLDNSVKTKKIFELIDNSYNLSLKK